MDEATQRKITFERLAQANATKREAKAILEEIPLLIEYLDIVFPPQDEEFEQRLINFFKNSEDLKNV